MMYSRVSKAQAALLLESFPAVALLGPRQVGKTTLAHEIARDCGGQALYLDLELPSDRAKLSEPEAYFAAHEGSLLILDEIQRMPDLFQVLRGVIDARRRKGFTKGQFLLLGSASIELLKQSSESLAGRIAYLEMTPLLAEEVDPENKRLDPLWVRGGFPESFTATNEAASFRWRLAFIRTYLERDIPALGPRIPSETLRRFWTMLAHEQGCPVNAAKLAAGLGVSGPTVARYLDLLVDLLLVRRLQPWSSNAGKRLVRIPKIYVRDSGLVHALLGLQNLDAVMGHPVAGGSWEGFVIENLIAATPEGTQPWFYRTAAGAEIDLVLEVGAERWAIEIKRSMAPSVSKGFYFGCEDIKAARRMVIYPGREAFKIGDGVEAMGLAGAVAALRGR